MKKLITITLTVLYVFSAFTQTRTTSEDDNNEGRAGSDNTFIGYQSGLNAGSSFTNKNTFIGSYAGKDVGNTSYNVAVGYNAGLKLTGTFGPGGGNSIVGAEAGVAVTTGPYNTIMGRRSAYNLTTGGYNTLIGYYSAYNLTTGGSNTLIGYNSGRSLTTQSGNVYIGQDAGYQSVGNNNVNIGYRSGYYAQNETGGVFIGAYAGENSTNNQDNCADCVLIGYKSGQKVYGNAISGYVRNVFIGFESGLNSTTASESVFVGYQAGLNNTTGAANVFIGGSAGASNTIGRSNVLIGYLADLASNSYDNVVVGGNSIVSGNNNILIGQGLTQTTSTNNSVGLGRIPTASNQVRIGSTSVTSIGGQVSWTTLSDGRFKSEIKEDISGLEFINKLRPVSYKLDNEKIERFLGVNEENRSSKINPFSPKRTGFIAQEVEKVINETGYVFTGIEKPQSESDHYSIRYAEFVVPLTKAVQELSKIVEEQSSEINELKKNIKNISVSDMSSPTDIKTIDNIELLQNTPNPFNLETEIHMQLPQNIQNAKIIIYDLKGTQIKSYSVDSRGLVNFKIEGYELEAGMYLYALLVDGKLIDSKRMILTKD
ncbi:tail fiber domain-containing protein [Ekhidna sp.]|uniref:tail fiber domain-containing protein n=1 Tax=Ekhidna sp. TaxID=2608089 RepID=UPI00329888B1